MIREIGSSFYKLSEDDEAFKVLKNSEITLKEHYTLYYSGRSAFYALLEEIHKNNAVKTIWIPEYYCQNVVNFLKINYKSIKSYYINPFNYNNTFNFQRFAKKGDVIILNNFWGLFDYQYDKNSKDIPIIIEDYSHGWLTKQSLNSKADYCIASVRKSYPIPGGGVTWKPNTKNTTDFYEHKKDDAIEKAFVTLEQSIVKKRAFLKHQKGDKATYLNLLSEGEAFITASNSYIKPNAELSEILNTYIKFNPNKIKGKNLEFLYKHIKKSKHFRVLKRDGFEPFGYLILFKDEAVFANFKSFCIQHNIYPANLWPNNNLRTQWKYFFNIHTDFRYTHDDMQHVANVINKWIEANQ